jgi:uncharacterized integral membrane protein (TIGR00697 family)
MNYILIVVETILSYIILLLFHKKFKLDGIYYYIIMATILSNIMLLNTIDILTYPISVGFGITSSIVIATIILTHKKGPSELSKLILTIIISSIISYSFLTLSSYMDISDTNKYTNISYSIIFKNNIRMYLANTISLILSIYLSTKLYHTMKQVKNKIWISNIFSAVIIEFIEAIIFCVTAYAFSLKLIDIIMIIVIRYVIRTLIECLGTIVIYIDDKIVK